MHGTSGRTLMCPKQVDCKHGRFWIEKKKAKAAREAERRRNMSPEQKARVAANRRRSYLANLEHQRATARAWKLKNRERNLANVRAWQERNIERVLYKHTEWKSRKFGIPFNLTLEDIVIPKRCPVFGLKMKRGRGAIGPTSPTVDRINPKKGYVRGNVAVISHLANRIKNEGTAAQHRRIADWIGEVSHAR